MYICTEINVLMQKEKEYQFDELNYEQEVKFLKYEAGMGKIYASPRCFELMCQLVIITCNLLVSSQCFLAP